MKTWKNYYLHCFTSLTITNLPARHWGTTNYRGCKKKIYKALGQGERTFFPLNKIKCEWETNKSRKIYIYCMSYYIIGYSFLFYELHQLGFIVWSFTTISVWIGLLVELLAVEVGFVPNILTGLGVPNAGLLCQELIQGKDLSHTSTLYVVFCCTHVRPIPF